jgi:hypothetical protein
MFNYFLLKLIHFIGGSFHTNERVKLLATNLVLKMKHTLVGFLKSQQVSVRENSQKKCASKSMIVHFLDSVTLLL